MPGAWLPCPGKTKATLIGLLPPLRLRALCARPRSHLTPTSVSTPLAGSGKRLSLGDVHIDCPRGLRVTTPNAWTAADGTWPSTFLVVIGAPSRLLARRVPPPVRSRTDPGNRAQHHTRPHPTLSARLAQPRPLTRQDPGGSGGSR